MAIIGIQTIVFGDTWREEPERVFETAARTGYDAVEFGLAVTGMGAAEVRRALDSAGLRCAGVHLGYEGLLQAAEEAGDYALAIGAPMVLVSGVGDRGAGKRAYVEAGRRLSEIGCRYRDLGLALAYHNHSFEFEPLDGRRGIDWLYDALDPECAGFCVDTYWVRHGGDDPLAWVARHGARIRSLHLKDMGADADRSFLEIGQGVIDFAPLLAEAERAGTRWWTVEQDRTSRTPEESARLSRQALHEMGY